VQLLAMRAGAEIVVTVRDNGAGIAAEVLPRLFMPFSPGAAAGHHPNGGLGVGLSLVRGLVERHGGRVEARSEGVGRGSEFIVYLPLGSPDTPAQPPPPALTPAEPARRLKVLVVDDNRDAADSCEALLELSGHEVQTAYSGQDGYLLADAFRPDVMLLDIGLPDIDGYALAHRIRGSHWGQGLALVALTGWGQEADKRRAHEAGFDHHLTKPVTFQRTHVDGRGTIERAVLHLCRFERVQSAPQACAESAPGGLGQRGPPARKDRWLRHQSSCQIGLHIM